MFSSLLKNKKIHSRTTTNVLALFMSWTSYSLFIPLHLLLIPSLFSSTVAAQLLNASSGIYSGLTVTYDNNVVRQYLGIEYARVHRRFDRATPVIRNSDRVISATSFGPLCKPTAGTCTGSTALNPFGPSCSISYGIFAVKAIPTEQCLFLNVFIPVTKQNTGKKAIFMWIHGGSGQIGTGNLFDGTVLAALGDIIVVTFNFRLNLFGFLSSGDERLEGNLGLYDQALVLDWITQNAPALGGDVRRITVGGHSAGAPHAYYLGVSPLNRGRIRRLLLQSGSPFNVWSHLKAHEAMEKFNAVANDNVCGGVRTFEEKLKCLQERDFDIVAEQEHHSYTSANHTNVVITGDFMSRFQENLEQNDTLANVDILMGANDDEGIYVAVVPIMMEQGEQEAITLNNVNFTAIALKFLSVMQPNQSCLHQKALEIYHIDRIPINCSQSVDCYCSVFYNYSRLISDILFNNDYYRFIQQRVKYSNRTYIYQYSHRTAQEHPTLCNVYLHARDLVGHFAELEYTWGTPLISEAANSTHQLTPLIKYIRYELNGTGNASVVHTYTDEQRQFSRQLIEQWSTFIKYGRPRSSLLKKKWPSVNDLNTAYVMHLQVNGSEVRKLTIPRTVQFWSSQCLATPTDRIRQSNQPSMYQLSWILLFCSQFFNKVLRVMC